MMADRIQPYDMDPLKDEIEASAAGDVDVVAQAVASMNLHDAAAYRTHEAKRAHPHYKRHGTIDAVTAEWHSYTAEELEALRLDRRTSLLTAGAFVLAVLGLGAAFWLGFLTGAGVLS